MIRPLAVAAGGCVGALLRWAVAGAVHRLTAEAAFPWGTFAVNAAGCLAIGFLAELTELRGGLGGPTRLFLFVGLLGGFTTFSTFGYETLALFREGSTGLAAANAAGQFGTGLLAVWVGIVLARSIV